MRHVYRGTEAYTSNLNNYVVRSNLKVWISMKLLYATAKQKLFGNNINPILLQFSSEEHL